MILINYFFLVIFCVVFFMMAIDKNVSDYLLLLIKMFKVNLERLKFLIILHPMNPITTWKTNRRAEKIARELQKEFSLRDTL